MRKNVSLEVISESVLSLILYFIFGLWASTTIYVYHNQMQIQAYRRQVYT